MDRSKFYALFLTTLVLVAAAILINYHKDWLMAAFSIPPQAIIGASVLLGLGVLSLFLANNHENDMIRNEFMTIVTHKFRTPLTGIKWVSEALKEDISSTEKQDLLRSLDQSNRKLAEIVDLLTKFVKFDNRLEYAFKAVSLRDMVYEALKRHSEAIRVKKIRFNIDSPSDLPLIVIDEMKIQFVIDTFFDNAIRYSLPESSIDVALRQNDRYIILSVKDQGIGIGSGDMRRVSRRFFRSDTAKRMDTEGLGLSLYTVKAIIARHKGKLKIESKGANKGTTIVMQIPKH